MFTVRKSHVHAPPTIAKARGRKKSTLDKLRGFLTAEEPETVKWLVNMWDGQSSAITYKELRESILFGSLTTKQLEKWQNDYAELVNTRLAPQWQKAMNIAAAERAAQYPALLYNPAVGAAQDYIRQHGAELVTALGQSQKEALNAMIQQAAQYEGMTADSLSRIMRPAIGLTAPQAKANINYYNAIWQAKIEAGASLNAANKAAREQAATYAAQQHRSRAFNIARTELAGAYNQGAYGATKQAQSDGYIGDVKKVWLTADDERVCPICGKLDGETVNIDEPFSAGIDLPPAHPNCRCGVAYDEIPNTNLTTSGNGDILSANTEAPPQAAQTQPAQPGEWPAINYPNNYSSKQAAIDRLKNVYGIDFIDGKKPMDAALLEDCVSWLDSFTAQYSGFAKANPVKLPKISIEDASVMKQAVGRYSYYKDTPDVIGIKLNAQYHSDISAFNALVQKIAKNLKIRWTPANSTTHKTFIHEYGHHVGNSLRWINKDPEWDKKFMNKVKKEWGKLHPREKLSTKYDITEVLSGYAAKSDTEMFAEAFAEFFGGKAPREFAQIFGKMLNEILMGVI